MKKESVLDILQQIGGFGRYQLAQTVLITLFNKSVMVIVLSMGFLTKRPDQYLCTFEAEGK